MDSEFQWTPDLDNSFDFPESVSRSPHLVPPAPIGDLSTIALHVYDPPLFSQYDSCLWSPSIGAFNDEPSTRALSRQNSASSLGSQYSRFEESSTLLGRGQRLTSGYQCTQCSSTFDTPSDLRQHERKHIPKVQKPHPCKVENCGERFLFPKDLRRHVERKHGNPFGECDACHARKANCNFDTQPCKRCARLGLHCVRSQKKLLCPAPECGLHFARQEHLAIHMRSLHADSSLEVQTTLIEASDARQTSSSPAPLTPDTQDHRHCRSPPYRAIERRYRQNLNAQLEKIRQKIPDLVDSHKNAEIAGDATLRPSKVEILTKAVARMTELEGNVDAISTINNMLESRLEEHERLRADGPSTGVSGIGVISPTYSGCPVALEGINSRVLTPPLLQDPQAIPQQEAASKKRKAAEPPSSERNACMTRECECLACGFNIECPRIKLLMNEKAELEAELKTVKADATIWLEERNTLVKALFEYQADHQHLTAQRAGDCKAQKNERSVPRRAKAWLTAIGILVGAKKKARGEEHESTDRALEQLSRDVEGLELP